MLHAQSEVAGTKETELDPAGSAGAGGVGRTVWRCAQRLKPGSKEELLLKLAMSALISLGCVCKEGRRELRLWCLETLTYSSPSRLGEELYLEHYQP